MLGAGFPPPEIQPHTKVAMREDKIGGFNERLASQAEARKALLEKFKPKPTVQAKAMESRAQRKAREVEDVRAKRVADKEAATAKVAADAEAARLKAVTDEAERREALANNEEAQLELKRQDRKDRKAQAKAEARAKREAKSAQRRG